MQTYNYETILRAIGRMLDLSEVRTFALREVDDGLALDLLDGSSEQTRAITFNLADVAGLVDWVRADELVPLYERAYASNEGTLQHFLQRHSRELVGSSR